MSRRRVTLIVLILCGWISAVWDAVGPDSAGTFGLEARPTSTPHELVVLGVAEGLKGIAPDDRLNLEGASVFAFQTARAGTVARVHINDSKDVTALVAQKAEPRPFDVEWAVIRMLTLVVATIVALVRPDLRAARALTIFLACIGLLSNWPAYPDGVALAGLAIRQLAMVIGFPQFVIFASTFAQAKPNAFTAWYRRAAFVIGVLFAIEIAVQQGLYFADRLWRPLEVAIPITISCFFVVGIRAFWLQLKGASGDMRQRILWVFATMTVSLTGAIFWLLFLAFPEPPTWMDSFALTVGLLPLGLGYAIVRHRILDISTAINATIAVTVTTAILTPVFGLLEYVVIEVVKAMQHGEPISLRVFFGETEHRYAALVIALSVVIVSTFIDRVHHRIDRMCRRLFFRERTHGIDMLRKASKDVLHIDDPKQLAEHLVEILDVHLPAGGTAVYVRDGAVFDLAASTIAGAPRSVGTNDPVILRLKSSDEPALLSELRSAVPGTYALSIKGGSGLQGLCVLDCSSRADALARDQLKAADSVADAAGIALDKIQIRTQRKLIAALRAELQSLKKRAVSRPS